MNEEADLSPAAQMIMEQIKQLSGADQKMLLKKLMYQQAMNDHDYQEDLVWKLSEEQNRKSS
jgi:hypothetical protein